MTEAAVAKLVKYRVNKLWDEGALEGALLMEIEPERCPIGLGVFWPIDTPEKRALEIRVGSVLTFQRSDELIAALTLIRDRAEG